MSRNTGKFVVVACIGLLICVLVLFSKVSGLSAELVDLRNSAAQSDASFSGQLGYVQDSIKESDTSSRSVDAQLLGKIESADIRISEKLQTTENDLRTELKAVSSTTDSNRIQLSKLKKEATGGLASALTKELVRDATKLALEKLNTEESLLIDPKFIAGVADVLVAKFREDLRGEPGLNADDAAVAAMLSKNPDFLDSVSVTVLLAKGEEDE